MCVSCFLSWLCPGAGRERLAWRNSNETRKPTPATGMAYRNTELKASTNFTIILAFTSSGNVAIVSALMLTPPVAVPSLELKIAPKTATPAEKNEYMFL
jgi:hypothetical protein